MNNTGATITIRNTNNSTFDKGATAFPPEFLALREN